MNIIVNIKHIKSYFLLVIVLLFPFKVAFCQDETLNSNKTRELDRIAAYGKIWGVINYFHPAMGKGKINADSLFLKHIAPLIDNPSTANFKISISNMLAELHDPQTTIKQTVSERKILATVRKNYHRSLLPGGQLYLALPQSTFARPLTVDSVLDNTSGKDVIIDLRTDQNKNSLGLAQYSLFIQPLIAGIIKSTMVIPTERSFYYKGLMRQDFPHDINILDPDKVGNVGHLQVNNGFKNISEGSYLLANVAKDHSDRRYCFIINKYVNINSVKALMALRNRNLCRLIFDGPLPDYLYGTFYYMSLPDNLTAKIRTSELIYEDGTLGNNPDLVIPSESDTTLTSSLIKSAINILKSPYIKQHNKHTENTVFIRRPANSYSTPAVPETKLRLLGLFNFWNTIHFFSPNKNLISVDWDRSLPYFIDKFLAANSTEKYFFALMELTASIRDGHGILINTKTGRSPKGVMDGNLPFACDPIGGKVYVTSIMPDTNQNTALAQLKYGDEIIAIDQIPVNSIIKKWKPLLVASNTSGFERELYATWFTAGAAGSTVMVRVSRKGRQKDIVLKRIKRDDYYNLWEKVERKPAAPQLFPPYCKVLSGNIGYLRMNKIFSTELDSLANLLKDCSKIIIDARGYPRDGQIGTKLASYIATKTDTVAYDKFPYIMGPDIAQTQTLIDYSVIKPNSNPNLKNKRYYILVDEGNQSQGEWNIIALQGVTKATTIGRTTAGANGMAVTINLPGDYITFFSGFGEYYPDHTPNQKLGVKIDVHVKKTLKVIIRGEDEILNKTLEIIKK